MIVQRKIVSDVEITDQEFMQNLQNPFDRDAFSKMRNIRARFDGEGLHEEVHAIRFENPDGAGFYALYQVIDPDGQAVPEIEYYDESGKPLNENGPFYQSLRMTDLDEVIIQVANEMHGLGVHQSDGTGRNGG